MRGFEFAALAALACSRPTPSVEATATSSGPRSPSAASETRGSAATAPRTVTPTSSPAAGGLVPTVDGGPLPSARARRVLHVGDSMAPLVGYYLRPLFRKDGRSYVVLAEDSSSTLSWDNARKLQEAVYEHDPDLVLVSLGSNELFEPRPERRRGAVRRLVADVKGRACLWIGPPAWKPDLGFVAMLRENLGHCRYFDSTALRLPRMDDGRHPTWTGGHAWATAVWRALGGEGRVPPGNPAPVPPAAPP